MLRHYRTGATHQPSSVLTGRVCCTGTGLLTLRHCESTDAPMPPKVGRRPRRHRQHHVDEQGLTTISVSRTGGNGFQIPLQHLLAKTKCRTGFGALPVWFTACGINRHGFPRRLLAFCFVGPFRGVRSRGPWRLPNRQLPSVSEGSGITAKHVGMHDS